MENNNIKDKKRQTLDKMNEKMKNRDNEDISLSPPPINPPIPPTTTDSDTPPPPLQDVDEENIMPPTPPIEDFDPVFVKELRKLNKIHRKQNNFSTDEYDVKDFQLKEYIKINKKTNYKYYGVVNKFYQYHRNKIYKEMNFKNVDENAPIELDDINIKLDNFLIAHPSSDDNIIPDTSNKDVFDESCEHQSDKNIIGVVDGDCVYDDGKKRLNSKVGGGYYFSNKNAPLIRTKEIADDSVKTDLLTAFEGVANLNYNLPVFKNMTPKNKETLDLLEKCIDDSKFELMGIVGDKSALTCILFNNDTKTIEEHDMDDDNLIELVRR
jgi:hypothetical protein